ncbi:glycosyltransferase [Psychrobacter sp. 2Y5]|uniref:glycosyltransferase n=1 Tax=unclassified Psychrobacter TaxID=196806 RepID=UPI003F46C58D
MKKLTYVLIRFSVLIEGTGSWNIADKNIETYKKKLFNPIRLEQHLNLFKKITIPSLLNQTKSLDSEWLKVVIITSESLPVWCKEQLEKLVEEYDWLYIDYIPEKGRSLVQFVYDDLKDSKENILVSTIRLDDDDALSNNFFEEMDLYFKKENVGFCLSFGSGYAGFYDFKSDNYEKLVEYYYPKLALGLSYFNIYSAKKNSFVISKIKTVYNTYRHTQVDLKSPTIIDSRKNMFIRTMYDTSDSANNLKREKLLRSKQLIENRKIYNNFPFLEKSLYDNKEFIEGINIDYIDNQNRFSYFANGFNSRDSDSILITFNAAIANRNSKEPPFFSGKGISNDLGVAILAFSDPLVDDNSNLNLAWYLGDSKYQGLNFAIKDIIKLACLKTNKRPLLFGCSGGGFAALVQSVYLSSIGIHHDILICNPQTNILNYKKDAVDRYFNLAESDNISSSTEKRKEYLTSIGSIYEINLSDIKTEFAKIYYIQNINDSFHVENHLNPFLENDFSNINYLSKSGYYNKDNFHLIISDFGSGHSAPSRADFVSIINKYILSKKDMNAIVMERTVVFKNKIDKKDYRIKFVFYMNKILLNLEDVSDELNLDIHLIVGKKMSGLVANLNALNKTDFFNHIWYGHDVSVSIFHNYGNERYSRRYDVVKN